MNFFLRSVSISPYGANGSEMVNVAVLLINERQSYLILYKKIYFRN